MTPAADVSQYQGTIDWATMPPIALIKMSGGDAGLYMDPNAAANYTNAKANGKAVGGYHFIGWTLGAIAEATYFLQAMSPLAENDVYALDIESIKIADPVSYVQSMVDFIHDKIGVWPLVYMNLSTLNAYNWDQVLSTCGLWLADWNDDPNATISTVHTYVMQQYSDGPNYDHDEWFGTIEQFNAYGYHAPQSRPTVATVTPTSTPSTEPVTAAPVAASESTPAITTPTPSEETVSFTTPSTTAVNTNISKTKVSVEPVTVSPSNKQTASTKESRSSWWALLWNWILVFIGVRE